MIRSTLLTACLALTLSCTPTQADRLVIRSDPGGSLQQRLDQIATLRARSTRVEIRGNCDSACTMLLGLPLACVAPTARFGFHGPQSQRYGISLPPDQFDQWSQVMAEHYPAAIRRWFLQTARQTTMGLVTLTARQAVAMGARPCAPT